jgi:predicted transcriptional regulator
LKVSDGYTIIPKRFIEHLKALCAMELKVALSLFLQLKLMKHKSQVDNGEIVTTLYKIREYAGYTKDDYSISDIEKVIYQLKDKHVLSYVELRGHEIVCILSQRLIEGRNTGYVAIYNRRLLRGVERLKDAELRVFMILLSYGQHNDKGIAAIETYIGKLGDMSRSTVQRAVVKLQKRGLISIVNAESKTIFEQNIYKLNEQLDKETMKALSKKAVEEHVVSNSEYSISIETF